MYNTDKLTARSPASPLPGIICTSDTSLRATDKLTDRHLTKYRFAVPLVSGTGRAGNLFRRVPRTFLWMKVPDAGYNGAALRVEYLNLTNVRNIARCEFEPSPGMNFLHGSNGQGKTNFVEAVYFLATLDYHRGTSAEFIRRGETSASIKSRVEVDELHRNIEITLEGRRRQVLVDGDPVRRVKDYLGRVLAVAFFPEDMQILLMEPSLRRQWLDKLLTLHHIPYRETLNRAKKALENRNRLLKDQPVADASLFKSVEAILSASAAEIMVRRRDMLTLLEAKLREIYSRDFDGAGTPSLAYAPSFDKGASADRAAIGEAYARHLADHRGRDIAAGTTLIGPHRDDFTLDLDSKTVRAHASRGEVRTALLCLNLAKVVILREKYDQEPIILLDDVLSELDMGRRGKALASLPPGSQVFITATERYDNIAAWEGKASFWKVQDGMITVG
jgi:DNA replication and repair protein RecF